MIASVCPLCVKAVLTYYRRDMESEDQQYSYSRYLLGEYGEARFLGRGAAELRLEGVDHQIAQALSLGISPDNRALRQNAGNGDDAAWDLTISVPKSVSEAFVQGDAKTKRRILGDLDKTVDRIIRHLERKVVMTRRGKGGRRFERVAGIVTMSAVHVISRYGDPQIHVHLVVFNVAPRHDGTWGSIHSRSLFDAKMAIGRLATAEMSNRLKGRGVELEADGEFFRIEKIPRELEELHSKGRQRIEEVADAIGLTLDGKVAEALHLAVRPAKEQFDTQAKFLEWSRDGRSLGVSSEYVSSLVGARRPASQEIEQEHAWEAACRAVDELSETCSTFTENDVLRQTADKCRLGEAGIDSVSCAVTRVLEQPDGVVRICDDRGITRYTTLEYMQIEQQTIELIERSKQSRDHVLPRADLDVAIEGSHLGEDQRRAVFHLAATEGSIKVLKGPAGTGKSRALAAIRESYEKSGYRVFGVAPTGVAARNLGETAGVTDAYTAAKFLWLADPRPSQADEDGETLSARLRISHRDLVIVDEAAMTGCRDMARILSVCDRAGAKAVVVGDTNQLDPVLSGASLFGELQRRLAAVSLDEIWRHDEEWMCDLNRHLRDRDVDAAIRVLLENDRLRVSRGFESPIDACVDELLSIDGSMDNRLALAPTLKQVGAINDRVQRERLRRGDLGIAAEHDGREFFDGDRVVFRKNDLSLAVANGDFGEIVAVRGKQLMILLDRKAAHNVPLVVRLDLRDYEHMELGYCATVHRSQGKSIDHCLVVADPGRLDKELGYVALTRQVKNLTVYSHELVLGDDLADLTRALDRSRREELAVELLARIEPEEIDEEQHLDVTWGLSP